MRTVQDPVVGPTSPKDVPTRREEKRREVQASPVDIVNYAHEHQYVKAIIVSKTPLRSPK
jgi:hypothetical protein